jgi:methionyl aminopeptidase
VHSSPPVIELKTQQEIDIMRVAGRAVAHILQILFTKLEPGISTGELDAIAFREIRSLGMKPAFLGYRGYPATACISINEELVHGIPRNDRIVHAGDIVTVDMGVVHNGYYGDAAATFPVGPVSTEASKLLQVTRDCLDSAIAQMTAGNRLGDVSWAIEQCAQKAGYAVVRDYVGHGIGRQLHEEPAVPNFGKPHSGPRLVPGMVLAIEPMVNCGSYQVRTLKDQWTVVTVDGRLCAHFEHMVAVTDHGHEVLTVL